MMQYSTLNAQLLHSVQEGNFEKFEQLVRDNSESDSLNWKTICYAKSGDTVLHVAAQRGITDVLKYLKDDANFEQSNVDGKRPLHEAAQFGQVECLQFLLSLGVSVDPLKHADWTPLMLACTKDNKMIVQHLLEAGANPNLRNKDGWTSFHIACREGSTDIINYLLDTEPTLWNTVSKNGRTPLHTAALHGKLDTVKILLNRGSYLRDIKDCCGTTPLMDAARCGHIIILELLITEHEIYETAVFLKNNCDHGGRSLRKNSELKVLKAKLNSKDVLGRNALHLAAQAGSLVSVQYLIDTCGMDVNCLSDSCQTALHLAAKEGQEDIIGLLLRLGIDPESKDSKGRKAYDIAKGAKHTRCCIILGSKEDSLQ